MHRVIPDISCTDAQRPAGLPVVVIVDLAQQQVLAAVMGARLNTAMPSSYLS